MAKGATTAVVPTPSKSSGGGIQKTITIINNSGKIVNTGKTLMSLFTEASTTYKEKKADLKLQRFLKRAQTYDATNYVSHKKDYEPSVRSKAPSVYRQEDDHRSEYRIEDDRRSRRTYDEQSVASSRRSHRSKHSTHSRHHRRKVSGQALTEDNLERLTEVSSTAPSQAPAGYRSPYAETLPAGVVSKANLTEYERRTEYEQSIAPTEYTQPPAEMARRHSESEVALQHQHHQHYDDESSSSSDDDDMHLAYGSLPPDLAQRQDLSPVDAEQAQSLVNKIEDLLDEVQCMEHTATEMIKRLQERPDAAAAVALTLAELSSFVGKLSPSFLGILKGGSPAVFALLASPQFLIGTGIAVGVTVVMFGGWKIVQRAKEEQRQALAFEAAPVNPQTIEPSPSEHSNGMDEALVLEEMEEELSTIETWRRGIVADTNWEKETAELELITPKADRERRTKDKDDDFDVRSHRSSRTHRSTKSHKSHKSSRHKEESSEKSEKKSRKNDDAASVASSSVSKRSSRKLKAIEDGSSIKGDDLPFRPKKQPNMLKSLFRNKEKHAEAIYAS